MKIYRCLVLLCSLFAALPVSAKIAKYEPYVLANISFTDFSWGSKEGINGDDVFKEAYDGLYVAVGSRFYHYFGMELGYGRTSTERMTNVLNTGQHTSAWFESINFEFIGYYPIDKAQTFELVGMAGIQYLKPHLSADYNAIGFSQYRGVSDEARGHIALGAEWRIAPNLALNLVAKAHDAHFHGLAEGINVYQMGFKYYWCAPKSCTKSTR